MDEITNLDLYQSMNLEIDRKISDLKSRLEKRENELNNPNNRINFIVKNRINNQIKEYKNQIIKLTNLKKSLFELMHADDKKYSLPNDIKEKLDSVASLISDEEVRKLKNIINTDLQNANKDKKNTVNEKINEVNKMLSSLNIGSKNVKIFIQKIIYSGAISYDSAVKTIGNRKLSELITNFNLIHKNEVEFTSDNNFISTIEEMINKNKLPKDRRIDNILSNFDAIKEAMNNKVNAERTLTKLDNLINNFKEIDSVDFSKTVTYLTGLQNTYKRVKDNASKYLSKFNFEYLKNEINKLKENEDIDRAKENKISTYKMLAYELEKTLSEHPEDYEKIQSLQEQMRNLEITFDLRKDEIDDIRLTGKNEYLNEREEQRKVVERSNEKIAYQDELEKSALASLRSAAIEELNYSKAFEPNSFYLNGDIRSTNNDREKLIAMKMEELKKMAFMSVEERGLMDFKKKGLISPSATTYDLTPSQLNDIRIGYSDGALGLTEYKDYMKKSGTEKTPDTIYKEYIKYRASLKDKTTYITFSDYAKQKYNLNNMDTTMVSEELQEELKGKTR